MANGAAVRPLDLRASMVDRPGAALRWLYSRFFASIRFEEGDVARIREAAIRGPVVYVLSSVSYLEFLYFNYALKKHNLPLARFANGGVRTLLLWPFFVALGLFVKLWRFARGAKLESEEAAMMRKLEAGESVLLFLRASRHIVSDRARTLRVRGAFTEELISLQRRRPDVRVQFVPMALLWGTPAVRPGHNAALDTLFGEREAPGRIRAFVQFVRHFRSSRVKVAEPFDLPGFLDRFRSRSDDGLARTLRFELSGRIESEKRVILGPPSKSSRRIRTEVLRSRLLQSTIDELASRRDGSRDALEKKAAKLVDHMAAKPERWMFVAMRRLLTFVWGRIYDGVDIDHEGLDRLREVSRDGLRNQPLLLMPSHKSHVDYLLLSWVFFVHGLPPPHVAAGANLSFFPMGWVFRRCAAFFLRRSFGGDALYTATFTAYVRRLIRNGSHLEFFIEGGRSRTGKLMPPKLGLLRIVCDAILDGAAPDMMVVPLAIGYEKVVEEGSYAKELAGGQKQKEDMGALLKAGRVLRSSYGRIDLQFNEPFSLAEALAEAGVTPDDDEAARRGAVARVARRILFGIAQATAVTPSALVAAACLAPGGRATTRQQLGARIDMIVTCARLWGARMSTALTVDPGRAIGRAVDLLASSGDLELRGEGDEQLVLVPEQARVRLEFYKNNLMHALGDVSIVARAVLLSGRDAAPGPDLLEVSVVRRTALSLSKMLKNELTYRPGATFQTAFESTFTELVATGWITVGASGEVRTTDEGSFALPVLAGLTGSYLESYRVATRAAHDYPDLTGTPLASRSLQLGEKMLLLGDIRRQEALSRPVMVTAMDMLRERGALADRTLLPIIETELAQLLLY